jgi:hypothetical protein
MRSHTFFRSYCAALSLAATLIPITSDVINTASGRGDSAATETTSYTAVSSPWGKPVITSAGMGASLRSSRACMGYLRSVQAAETWWVEVVHPWRQDLPQDLPWPVAARQRIAARP